jgi:hypothetical protein
MRSLHRVPILAALALALPELAGASSPAELAGVWRGTSTCVDKERWPSCNDETVVYRMRRSPKRADAVELTANKIVNGEEVTMGVSDLTWDAKARVWTWEFQNARVHGLWSFSLDGDRLHGTLSDLPTKRLVRRVEVKKEP